MKRLSTIVLTALLLASPASALAQPAESPNSDLAALFSLRLPNKQPLLLTPEPKPAPEAPAKPEPVVYTVVAGDTLTSIGTANNVEWQRIWAKNTQLTHPDVLAVGDRLTIPLSDEQLDRPLPETVSLPETTPGVTPSAYSASQRPVSGLFGSIGYARAGGNCVNEPGVNSPRDGTNPISWAVLYYQPHIGATALWRGINHTGVVTGIWSNGDVEVRHQNWSGAPVTRFPASAFRGYR